MGKYLPVDSNATPLYGFDLDEGVVKSAGLVWDPAALAWVRAEAGSISIGSVDVIGAAGDTLRVYLTNQAPNAATMATKGDLSGITEEMVYIDTPVEDFEERLVEITLGRIGALPEVMVKKLAWSFRKGTINEIVQGYLREEIRKIVREAFQELAMEMKKTTSRIV